MIKVAAIQLNSSSNIDDNFKECEKYIDLACKDGAMFVCLPENFAYFGEKPGDSLKYATTRTSDSLLSRYCGLARKYNVWLSLGGMTEVNNTAASSKKAYNSHFIIDDSGCVVGDPYRKVHLFDATISTGTLKESSYTTPGDCIVTVKTPFASLGLSICYDLRFPQLYQTLRCKGHANMMLVPSAFTKETGEAHWMPLLRARAIETQSYVIAAAQVGTNGKRACYGHSCIIDPWGTILNEITDDKPGYIINECDMLYLNDIRTDMPIVKHRMLQVYHESVVINANEELSISISESKFEPLSPSKQSQQNIGDKYLLLLTRGDAFVKHGRDGKSKRKWVFYNQGCICWVDFNGRKEGNTHQLMALNDSKLKKINISNIHTIEKGKKSKVFQKNVGSTFVPAVPEQLCMTIVSSKRTLDLQAKSVKQRDVWVSALEWVKFKMNAKTNK